MKVPSQSIEIDRKTSRSICDEMGEGLAGLQEDLRPETSPLPPYIDELRKQDEMRSPNKTA